MEEKIAEVFWLDWFDFWHLVLFRQDYYRLFNYWHLQPSNLIKMLVQLWHFNRYWYHAVIWQAFIKLLMVPSVNSLNLTCITIAKFLHYFFLQFLSRIKAVPYTRRCMVKLKLLFFIGLNNLSFSVHVLLEWDCSKSFVDGSILDVIRVPKLGDIVVYAVLGSWLLLAEVEQSCLVFILWSNLWKVAGTQLRIKSHLTWIFDKVTLEISACLFVEVE